MTDYTAMLHFARTFLCYNLSKNGVHIYHLDKNECGEVLRRWFMYDFFQGNLLNSNNHFPSFEAAFERYKSEEKYYRLNYSVIFAPVDDFPRHLFSWLEPITNYKDAYVVEKYTDRWGRSRQRQVLRDTIWDFPVTYEKMEEYLEWQKQTQCADEIFKALDNSLSAFNALFT